MKKQIKYSLKKHGFAVAFCVLKMKKRNRCQDSNHDYQYIAENGVKIRSCLYPSIVIEDGEIFVCLPGEDRKMDNTIAIYCCDKLAEADALFEKIQDALEEWESVGGFELRKRSRG